MRPRSKDEWKAYEVMRDVRVVSHPRFHRETVNQPRKHRTQSGFEVRPDLVQRLALLRHFASADTNSLTHVDSTNGRKGHTEVTPAERRVGGSMLSPKTSCDQVSVAALTRRVFRDVAF